MNSMFRKCKELEYLNLSNFDTSNVENMEGMFNECNKLKEIKGIDNFNTSNVTNMSGMFQECNELEHINLSNFDTSNVENMKGMFTACQKLKEIQGINSFNTSKVIDMKGMFIGCKEIEYLDLSNIDTSNVQNMDNMFGFCFKLKEIKGIENFNLSNVTSADEIFEECNALKNYDELVFLFGDNINPNIQPINELNLIRKDIKVNFVSIDQKIKYSINCSNLDVFSTLIEILCNKFNVLKNKKKFFLANGNILKKNLTLEQNKINDGDQILINVID